MANLWYTPVSTNKIWPYANSIPPFSNFWPYLTATTATDTPMHGKTFFFVYINISWIKSNAQYHLKWRGKFLVKLFWRIFREWSIKGNAGFRPIQTYTRFFIKNFIRHMHASVVWFITVKKKDQILIRSLFLIQSYPF